jgi:hypothetical protein
MTEIAEAGSRGLGKLSNDLVTGNKDNDEAYSSFMPDKQDGGGRDAFLQVLDRADAQV